MDRETLGACSSLIKLDSKSCTQLQPEHFLHYIQTEIPYSQFFIEHLLHNRPCMFSSTFTQNWSCRSRWVSHDGKPDFHTLLQEFPDETPVPVADCDTKEYNSNPKHTMSFREFLSYWRHHIHNGHSSPNGCLYLKDWHMHRMFPDHGAYTTPIYFSSDWLNEYWDTLNVDDYRFVYMGPKGSWTPFHADVFRSYSWSANICGRKKWLLYPPGQEEFLRDCCGNLPFDVTSPAVEDRRRFPRFSEACRPLEVIQEAGEILFVPSGWHHQVYNLEDTISINHNWLNSCNVDVMWEFLQGELLSVQREIDEWRDTMESWDHHCQVMMKSCTGIDYSEFASFLKTIANNRISFLSHHHGNAFSETLSALGPHHATFDLQRVAQVLERMLGNEDFKRVLASESGIKMEKLLQEIRDTISKHNTAY